ncbi:RIC1-domain-containing protein [Rhizophagus irregularis]|uniref:RIC1-domain-containing protein n=1 Tax=Rhizophagus irregularis TaxID=588596 RepID=A0A2N0Q560_9GLOM|nr:RIC1-domain-containing protein [Rhizophagus irregularis]
MYWASGIAKALVVIPPDYNEFNPAEEPSSSGETIDLKNTDALNTIIRLRRNKTGNLFVTLTKNSLQLWSVRPTAMISQVIRTSKSVEEYGDNCDVFWKPDGTLILVQTSQNCLFTYSVLTFEDKSYKYQFGQVSHHYITGAGEGNGIRTYLLKFRMTIRIDAGMEAGIGIEEFLIVTTKNPPAIQCIPWQDGPNGTKTNILARLEFLEDKKAGISSIVYNRRINIHGWITTDGKAYAVQFNEHRPSIENNHKAPPLFWTGFCFHSSGDLEPAKDVRATCIAINAKFSLLAVGTEGGMIYVYFAKNYNGSIHLSHKLLIWDHIESTSTSTGPVTALAWTSDGHAIAVGWKNEGLAVWSVYGRLLMTTVKDDWPISKPTAQDSFLHGVNDLFWSSGNCELFILHTAWTEKEVQLYTLPFAKSAVTTIHSPDNAKRGFLQMDDRLLLYRGGDQEDLSAINPDTIVWQHIPIPIMYISDNWPIKYASISSDGRYIAIAGRRGLAHHNVSSGRWKLFGNQQQEQEFAVRGGLLWYKQTLVAACENVRTHTYEIRMYSRETNLDNIHIIQNIAIPSTILYLSIMDNALLVYCGDNMMYHYLIVTSSSDGRDSVLLELCQQISFVGVIHAPARVRSISWFQPRSHRPFTPETIQSASIIFLIDGKLVLLHPKKSDEGEVQYDLHILADKIEFYWMSTRGIGSLKNSLWACDGQGVKIWMNIWSNEESARDRQNDVLLSATKECLRISLEFYPLSVLLDKGIIVGVQQQTSIRQSLEFPVFKLMTNTHLFLQHILRYMLTKELEEESVAFATSYQKLVYFGHAVEMLLHHVLEDEAEHAIGTAQGAVLPKVVKFLNNFPHSLDAIVGCARKTEVALWDYLFSIVGSPKDLFERCMSTGLLKTATSYLLVLHTLEPSADSSKDTIRLLSKAMKAKDYELCKELVRFLNSIDGSGRTLKEAVLTIQQILNENLESPTSCNFNNNNNVNGNIDNEVFKTPYNL